MPYKKFVTELASHQPGIWKDPRLRLTIRRQIQTLDYLHRYMHGIRDSIRDFVFENDLPCLELNFDNVLMEPEKTIGQLNDFLGCQLTVDDLKAIYHGELYRKPRDTKDLVKAGLIYLKNYGERYR